MNPTKATRCELAPISILLPAVDQLLGLRARLTERRSHPAALVHGRVIAVRLDDDHAPLLPQQGLDQSRIILSKSGDDDVIPGEDLKEQTEVGLAEATYEQGEHGPSPEQHAEPSGEFEQPDAHRGDGPRLDGEQRDGLVQGAREGQVASIVPFRGEEPLGVETNRLAIIKAMKVIALLESVGEQIRGRKCRFGDEGPQTLIVVPDLVILRPSHGDDDLFGVARPLRRGRFFVDDRPVECSVACPFLHPHPW
jgi:hypothetical protein